MAGQDPGGHTVGSQGLQDAITYMDRVDQIRHQALPQLLVAAGPMEHQIGHVRGAITRQKGAAKVSYIRVADALRPKTIWVG